MTAIDLIYAMTRRYVQRRQSGLAINNPECDGMRDMILTAIAFAYGEDRESARERLSLMIDAVADGMGN
jgi:hypothetical protein